MLRARLKIKQLLVYPITFFLVLGFLTSAGADNLEQPAWLQQARDEARQEGYELITALELKALYESGKDFTIVDVRPEYEYRDGHLPQAKSLEFDLGDKLDLTPEKQVALINLLGPDKQRMIVIYCRSFA
jgi:rhodanese-related sulfurtransferase